VRLRIPRGGFRSTRRGVVSALLADGAAPAVVQEQLRHSDPRITLGVYAHVIGNQQRDAVAVSVFMVALTTGYGLPCGAVSTVRVFSILIHRAGRLSCGATILNGPCFSPSGEPFRVSATITSDS